jgi:hypothetical protein
MVICIHDHTLVDDVYVHFRRSGFTAERLGGGMVEVAPPDASNAERARCDVLLHLRVWSVINPAVSVELLD